VFERDNYFNTALHTIFKQLFIISFSKYIMKSFIHQKKTEGEDRERTKRGRNSIGNKIFLNWFQRFRIEPFRALVICNVKLL